MSKVNSLDSDESPINRSSFLIDKSQASFHNVSMTNNSLMSACPDRNKSACSPKEYWIKTKVKYEVRNKTFELGPDNRVFLNLDLVNLEDKTWHTVMKLKGHNLAEDIEHPISKRVKAKQMVNLQVNLKRTLAEMRGLLGQEMTFELVGNEKQKNIKYYSDHLRVKIDENALNLGPY